VPIRIIPFYLVLAAAPGNAQKVCSCLFVGPSQPSGVLVLSNGVSVPAQLYMVVHSTDRLIVGKAPTASLFCERNRRVQIAPQPANQHVPCEATDQEPAAITDGEGRLRYLDKRVLGADDETVPLTVLSPRIGVLRDSRPTVRFVPREGAEEYDLEVVDAVLGAVQKVHIRPKVADGVASVAYPASLQVLQQGHTYRFRIRLTNDDPDLSTSFAVRVIEPAALREIELREKTFREHTSDEASLRVELALLHLSRELYVEAASDLNSGELQNSPEILRMEAEVDHLAGLNQWAAEKLGRTIAAPLKDMDTIAGQARSYREIAELHELAGDRGAAITAYRQSAQLWAQAGNAAQAAEIQQALARLGSK
jgi:hypothetical protein